MRRNVGWKLFDIGAWILSGMIWIHLVIDCIQEWIESIRYNATGTVGYGVILLFFFVPGMIGLYLLWKYRHGPEKKVNILRWGDGLLSYQVNMLWLYLLRKLRFGELWANRQGNWGPLCMLVLVIVILFVSSIRIQNTIAKEIKKQKMMNET